MASKKGLGPVKRFGVRYGRTVKHKLAKIEKEQKKNHLCPYCSREKVSRVSYGIWNCKKCDSTFTGRAYNLGSSVELTRKSAAQHAEFPEFKSKVQETEEEEA